MRESWFPASASPEQAVYLVIFFKNILFRFQFYSHPLISLINLVIVIILVIFAVTMAWSYSHGPHSLMAVFLQETMKPAKFLLTFT